MRPVALPFLVYSRSTQPLPLLPPRRNRSTRWFAGVARDPRLREAQISVAPIYAEAYPRGGRPRSASPSRRQEPHSSFVV